MLIECIYLHPSNHTVQMLEVVNAKLKLVTPSPIHIQLINNIHSNIEGIEICGSVSIGTPPQTFTVAFLSDIPYLLVDSLNCVCNENSHTRYNHMKSTSYEPNGIQFSIINNTHLTANGFLSNDKITIADTQINIPFGEITHEQEIAFTVSGCDGILGLGFKDNGHPATILTELVDKNLIPELVFGLHFNRDSKSENGGELVLGGTNTRYYDPKDLHYGNLTNGNAWEVKVHSVKVSGVKCSLCDGGCNATINPVDPFIIGNFENIQALNKQLGAKSPAFGVFVFNCSTLLLLPVVTIVVDGFELYLSGEDYVYKTVEPAACFSRFQGVLDSSKNKLTLGNSLIRRYYAVFDAKWKKVGFAKESS